MEQIKGDAAVIAERMENLLEVQDVDISEEGVKVVAVPAGKTLQSLKKYQDEWLDTPRRREGTSIHRTLESLVAHANTFKSDDSVLFADPGDGDQKDPVLLAVYNYNPKGGEQDATGWRDHKARYAFPLSEQWKAWKAIDGKAMSVADFANFLEGQIEDLGDPSDVTGTAKQLPDKLGMELATPAQILALSKGLAVRVDQSVTNVVNVGSGEQALQFEEKHSSKEGGPLRVPQAFVLNIPVFKNGVLYKVGARLRYSVSGPRVTFTVHLYREDIYLKDAFELACEEAKNATQLPLFIGSPE